MEFLERKLSKGKEQTKNLKEEKIMSEEKKNMEDLLQSELDLGDTEAVGAADDPFANIGANDDPFAGVNGTEDTFVDIENDNNNPFNDVAAEKPQKLEK